MAGGLVVHRDLSRAFAHPLPPPPSPILSLSVPRADRAPEILIYLTVR